MLIKLSSSATLDCRVIDLYCNSLHDLPAMYVVFFCYDRCISLTNNENYKINSIN